MASVISSMLLSNISPSSVAAVLSSADFASSASHHSFCFSSSAPSFFSSSTMLSIIPSIIPRPPGACPCFAALFRAFFAE